MVSMLRSVFSFPHPVNEVAARVVAGSVLLLSLVILVTGWYWLLLGLTYGFLARVLTGPTLSPIGLIATKVIVPIVIKKNKPVAGPPKRFAQFVGLIFSATALYLSMVQGAMGAAAAVLVVLALFAALESVVGFCAGCFVFGYLMRWGLVPSDVCERCNSFNLDRSSA